MEKRKLTEAEKQEILEVISFPPIVHPLVRTQVEEKIRTGFETQLREITIYPDVFPRLKEAVEREFHRALAPPGMPVGIIAAQSIGEPITQMNLNSVIGSTTLLLRCEKKLTYITIGEFVNGEMDSHPESGSVTVDSRGVKREFLPLTKDVYVPSVDEQGINCWDRVIGVIRHPVRTPLLKVTTAHRQEVIATEARSFLRYHEGLRDPAQPRAEPEGKLEPTDGSQLRVGDLLPVLDQGFSYHDRERRLNNVLLIPITAIEEVETTELVYDLSTEKTQNFALANGLVVRDSFHSAGGASNVHIGFPRYEELLNASKTPKHQSSTIYFRSQPQTLDALRDELSRTLLVETSFAQLISKRKVVSSSHVKEPWWYQGYRALYTSDFAELSWCVIYKLKQRRLFNLNLTLAPIARHLEELDGGVICVFSPLNLGEIHVYLDVPEGENPRPYIFSQFLPDFEAINLSPISGIKEIYFRHSPEGEWYLETEGSNLPALLALPHVDPSRTVSDNMWEIYSAFGLEATRHFLIEALYQLISYDGTYIAKRHVELLVDAMTLHGVVKPITRHGFVRKEEGPLSMIAFEETLNQILTAGKNGETEEVKGVSASVICAKTPRIGSGMVDLQVDLNRLFQLLEERVEQPSAPVPLAAVGRLRSKSVGEFLHHPRTEPRFRTATKSRKEKVEVENIRVF